MKQYQTKIKRYPNRIKIENIIDADVEIRNRILKALAYPPEAISFIEKYGKTNGLSDVKLFTTYDGINEQLTAKTNTIPTILKDGEPIPKRVVFFEYKTVDYGWITVGEIEEVEVVVRVKV